MFGVAALSAYGGPQEMSRNANIVANGLDYAQIRARQARAKQTVDIPHSRKSHITPAGTAVPSKGIKPAVKGSGAAGGGKPPVHPTSPILPGGGHATISPVPPVGGRDGALLFDGQQAKKEKAMKVLQQRFIEGDDSFKK